MARDLCVEWSKLAHLLLRVECFPLDRMPSPTMRYSHEVDLYRFLDSAIGSVGSDRDASVGRVMDALVQHLSAEILDANDSFPRWNASRAMTVKAFRYAYGIAAGRPEIIPRHEVRQVRDLLATAAMVPEYSDVAGAALIDFDRMAPAGRHPESSSEHASMIEFRFTWRPWSRSGRGDTRFAEAKSVAKLQTVAVEDAPAVLRLRPPADSALLPIRMVGGSLYRPVLSAGSWTPITVSEFIEAAVDGRAWADNPFLSRRTEPISVRLGVDDVVCAVRRPNRRDVQARADAEAACLVRAGHLCVVEGKVYKRTSLPRLHVVVSRIRDATPFAGDPKISLAWSLNDHRVSPGLDLASWLPQTTFRSRPERHSFLVDWPAEQATGRGFATEMQDVLRRALILFGAALGNPGLRVDAEAVVLGEGLPMAAELLQASSWAAGVRPALCTSSIRSMGSFDLWRMTNETALRRAFADALSSAVACAGENVEEDTDLFATF